LQGGALLPRGMKAGKVFVLSNGKIASHPWGGEGGGEAVGEDGGLGGIRPQKKDLFARSPLEEIISLAIISKDG